LKILQNSKPDSLSALVWQYARTVFSFSLSLSFAFGVLVAAMMVDRGFVSPDLSFKAITFFLLGKLPSCLVAFFLLLRLTFVASFDHEEDQSLEVQMLHPVRHIIASVWVAILGWELSMIGACLGLIAGLLIFDPAQVHDIWAYLSVEYDMTIALRSIVRTVLQAVAMSWLLYLESVIMIYWRSDKETRMTQFIFLGLITLIAIEVFDTILFFR
jgi:hypothetical protein